MSRGYGLSITPLQLAHAYATVAAGGVSRPISFLRVETPPAGERALDPGVSRMLIHLLEAVVAPDGGGKQAAIPGYTVAGKTGTAWKATAGGYATDRYLAVFGGIAPASNPRLAAVVIIDEPGAGKYYGGDVAAPVFSGVVGGALRLLAVPPDAPVGDDDGAAPRARWPSDEHCRRAVAEPRQAARWHRRRCRATSRSPISRRTGAPRVPAAHSSRCAAAPSTASSTRRRPSPTARARCCGSPRRWP